MVRASCLLVVACATALACVRNEVPVPPSPASPPAVPASMQPAGPVAPASVERVSPEVARASVQAGQALLVCAYDDAKCAQLKLEGSIPISALLARLPQLPKDQEIIVFCA
jgi:hypothetical protein